jgi:uncharacterized protein YbjT (DUF2867 family)
MILIVGSSGVLGQVAARQLSLAGHRVRVLTRNPALVADMAHAGVEIYQGDLTMPATLLPALAGADTVLTAAHGLLGRGRYRSELVDDTGHRALIDAACAMGVQHFIYTSAHGASPTHPIDFFRTKHKVEEYLRRSGLCYTILRPSAFMEWHAHNLLGKNILEKGKTTIFGAGDTPTNFVAAHDVAQLIAHVVNNPAARNRIIPIGGPSNPTKNEVAALYGQQLGISPRIGHLPPRLLKALAKVVHPIHPGVSRIMRMGALADELDHTLDMKETLRQYPLQLTSIDTFVKLQVTRYFKATKAALSPLAATPV